MKKIIKLTESELKSLIERIVRENLNESITVNGVTLSAANRKSGGPILAKYKNITDKYSVTVDTVSYDGPVGVKYIYKKNGKYYMTDNTNKTFKLPYKKLTDIINSIKKNKKVIKINVGGYFGADITLTKK